MTRRGPGSWARSEVRVGHPFGAQVTPPRADTYRMGKAFTVASQVAAVASAATLAAYAGVWAGSHAAGAWLQLRHH